MEDYATFLQDLSDDDGVVFEKGKKYEILDENKEFYYIQIKPRTNQVSQIPKNLEGKLFKV